MNNPTDYSIREHILSLVDWSNVSSVLDLGCGSGDDLREIAVLTYSNARLVGVDTNEKAIEVAREQSQGDERLTFIAADAANGLPFDANSFDVVFSKNLLECIVDKDAHLMEIHRVLPPGGTVLCAHYDWDSQLIDGEDKELVRKIVYTFADWKQAWMTDSDGWMGRRLWRTFQRSGLFQGAVNAKTLIETEFVPGAYAWDRINDFRALVHRGMVSAEEFERFYRDIEQLAERGEYLYSITMFVYVGEAIVSQGKSL
ncbi:MAG: methyltransferase domain-containing protein [Capsulimonadaceae bacterium]|nr:methyltransferase domain-containing protein [Capsulimonadaceae bacterium]